MNTTTTTIESAGSTELPAAPPVVARTRPNLQYRIDRMAGYLGMLGLGWIAPIARLATGENPREQLRQIWTQLGIPLAAIVAFLAVWAWVAPSVQTSLGAVPGPAQVWAEARNLAADHAAERARAAAFHERQEQRNAERLAQDPQAEIK